MSQKRQTTATPLRRMFANYYERTSKGAAEKTYIEPLRKEIVGQAKGVVLEIGAGNGLNFAHYRPEQVERVEATEPSPAMLNYAQTRARNAPVPVTLTSASVENLPFADASFDSVVCTLVFCSVQNPQRGIQEILRVLKPGGHLFMLEHVRAQGGGHAFVQNMLTPFTRLFMDNCHWNRRTEQTVSNAGFQRVDYERRSPAGELIPIVMLVGTR